MTAIRAPRGNQVAAAFCGAPRNARLIIDVFSKGQAIKSYGKIGIGGLPTEMFLMNETGDAARRAQDLRNLSA